MHIKKIKEIIKLSVNSRFLVRGLQHKFVERNVAFHSYGTVLDIGSGKNPYKKLLTYKKYVCVDIEDRVGDGSVVIADINVSIPCESESIDLILCTEVIEHLHTPSKAFEEMYRVLAPGGTLLLTTPMVWEEHEVPHDFFRYTQYGVRALSVKAGFKNINISLTNGYWYTMVALLNSRMRSIWFAPIVLVLNCIGRVVYTIEKPGRLPLGIHAVIKKHGQNS